jgi:diguanylate cyclase (GGDEF)-like protein
LALVEQGQAGAVSYRGRLQVLEPGASSPIVLDVATLFVVATCVTALLGMFLLFAWVQDRVRALAWWGCAYLVGSFAVALWSVESAISPPLPPGSTNSLLFVACGMIWNAGRLFHGRPVLWGAQVAGGAVWVFACTVPEFVGSLAARIVLSSIIISIYTCLAASELWNERRKRLLRRWPAIVVPIMHGAVFLAPIPLASVLPEDRGTVTLASGWIAVFALEVMLYVVGTAFIVLVLAKERAVRIYRNAALTDELTGLLNRRGFNDATHQLMARRAKMGAPVSVLVFDLDHFKEINDRFGHAVGDAVLCQFAKTLALSTRTTDIVGRIGGEEFVAVLPGPIEGAAVVAERVRTAFQAACASIAEGPLQATVSVGVASASSRTDIAVLLCRADIALYRAKSNGRNRIEYAAPEEAIVERQGQVVREADGVDKEQTWPRPVENKIPLSAA